MLSVVGSGLKQEGCKWGIADRSQGNIGYGEDVVRCL